MIFKSEKDISIKKIVETVPKSGHEWDPYDYRTDLSAREMQFLKRQMARERELLKWKSYISYAVALNFLTESKDPPLTRLELDSLVEEVTRWIEESSDESIGALSYNILMLTLYDRNLLSVLPLKMSKLLARRMGTMTQENFRIPSHRVYAEVAKKIFLPSVYIPPGNTLEFLCSDIHLDSDNMNEYDLETLAWVRVIDSSISIPLKPEHWKKIRELVKSHTYGGSSSHPPTAFFARILAAKDVFVDKDGLHIIDPDSTPIPQSESKPIPSPKRI